MAGRVDGWSLVGVSDGNRYLFARGRGRKARGLILYRGTATDIGTPQAALSRLDWGRPTRQQRKRGYAMLEKATIPAEQQVHGR